MQYEPLIEEVCSDEEEERRLAPALVSVPTAPAVSINHSSNVHVGTVVNVTPPTETVKGLPQYLKTIIKGSTKTERVSFIVIFILIMFIISIGVYFKITIDADNRKQDSTHPWIVSREEWMARSSQTQVNLSSSYQPLRLVVIQHSVTHECVTYTDCRVSMKELQNTFLTERNQDVPYNFFVGNDGRVYEGRGWGVQSIHSYQLDPCVLSIGFIGDYREELDFYSRVTAKQVLNIRQLLAIGIEQNYLDADYYIQGAKDLFATESPGSNLYNAIQKWEHYDPEHRYKELTCEQIHSLKSADVLDIAPHEWHITREMWQAEASTGRNSTMGYEPLRLVVIQNTVSQECHSFIICKIAIQKLQIWYSLMNEDIPYNFIIANDGRVYEARGWGVDGGHSRQYNLCAMSIGFLGEYSDNSTYNTKVSAQQMNRTRMLLEEGVRLGRLHPEYVVVGAKDMFASDSPGDNLYNEIQKLEHYDHKLRYKGQTCDEIGPRSSLLATTVSNSPEGKSVIDDATEVTTLFKNLTDNWDESIQL